MDSETQVAAFEESTVKQENENTTCENSENLSTDFATTKNYKNLRELGYAYIEKMMNSLPKTNPEEYVNDIIEYITMYEHVGDMICLMIDKLVKFEKTKPDNDLPKQSHLYSRVLERSQLLQAKIEELRIGSKTLKRKFPFEEETKSSRKFKQAVEVVTICEHEDQTKPCKQLVLKKYLDCDHTEHLPCHIDVGDLKCKMPITRQLKCKHEITLECHVDTDNYLCMVEVERILPHCGHKQILPCHVDISKAVCQEKCYIRLKCGHSCSKNCHPLDDPEHEKYLCQKPCGKIVCERGHKCKNLCFDVCNICSTLVEKVGPCGHFVIYECQSLVPSTPCKQPCLQLLPCGHPCTKLCSDECITNCEELVTFERQCGHEIEISCKIKRNTYIEAELPNCFEACHAVLPCGHQCPGNCNDCSQGRVHLPCDYQCNKPLVCGHLCSFPCSEICPPCRRKCNTKCNHSKCNKRCGDPCSPCIEPCTWNCPHFKCEKKCNELCDRPRCNEPCNEVLKCGHSCIGLCGEQCPTLCKTCNKKELQEFVLQGYEEDEDARFVQLVDCGHCLEVRALDQWMETTDGCIKMKECPRCKTTIWRSNRYGDIIKQRLADIQNVKAKKFDKKDGKALADALIASIDGDLRLQFPEEINHIINVLKQKGPVDQNRLIIIQNQLNVLTSINNMKREFHLKMRSEQIEKTFTSKTRILIANLMTHEETMHDHRIEDITEEVIRIRLLINGLNVLHQLQSLNRPLDYLRDVTDLLFCPKKLSIENVKLIDRRLTEVCKGLPGLGITNSERIMIVRAMNLPQGHWYKCNNGHVYAIGECGRAMQSSTCLECGSQVGGTNHTLLPGNYPTNEMNDNH